MEGDTVVLDIADGPKSQSFDGANTENIWWEIDYINLCVFFVHQFINTKIIIDQAVQHRIITAHTHKTMPFPKETNSVQPSKALNFFGYYRPFILVFFCG